MQFKVAVTLAVALGAWCAAAPGGEAGLAMDTPVKLAHAGICLAVPKGFEHQPLREPCALLRAVRRDKGKPIQAVDLAAFAVGPKDTLEGFAEKMLDEARKTLAVRQLRVRKKTAMTVASLPASARLLTYTYRGVETTAARVFFLRPMQNGTVRLCYVLTVESGLEHKDDLLPVLGEVIKTVKLVDVQSPLAVGVAGLMAPVPDTARGYAVRPPLGWYAAETSVGVQMAVTDYRMGGEPAVTVSVAVAACGGQASPRAHAAEAIERATQAAGGQGRATAVVAQTPALLGGVAAHQFTLLQTAKEPRTGDRPVYVVHRLTCCRLAEQAPPQCFSLILVCRGGDAKTATEILGKIASGFSFLQKPARVHPATAPATQPATHPTTQPTTRPAATGAPKT